MDVSFFSRLQKANRFILYLLKLKLESLAFFLQGGKISLERQEVEVRVGREPSRDALNLIEKVDFAIEYANRLTKYPAPRKLRFREGMSGQRFRAFLNQLSKLLGEYNYLEIGVWKGSTATCVLFESSAKAVLIDNWSQFGGPSSAAKRNLKQYIRDGSATLVDSSLESILEDGITFSPKLYFYDGDHEYESHLKAIQLLEKLNFENLILVIDDWNWLNVREGTREGIERLNLKIHKEWEISTVNDTKGGKYSAWHNGTYICVLSK
jgi:hypothetical protein